MQDEKSLISDCKQLLENILSEAPKNHEYILAIVAKADKPGVIFPDSNSSFPNFYGYVLDRTKMYMMTDLKVTSNVPRQGSERRIMTAHYLVYWDKIVNGYSDKPLADKMYEIASATWAWTSNTSKYKNAELIMVFRSKAEEFLSGISDSDFSKQSVEEILWPSQIKSEGTNFLFGENLSVSFKSKDGDRYILFKAMFDKSGHWVKVQDMCRLINKDAATVRTIMNQIQSKKINGSAVSKIIKIEAHLKDPGAYRIVYTP